VVCPLLEIIAKKEKKSKSKFKIGSQKISAIFTWDHIMNHCSAAVVHCYNPAIIKEKLIPWFSACWDKTICHLETGVLSLFFVYYGRFYIQIFATPPGCTVLVDLVQTSIYFQVCQHHVVMCKNSQALCLHANCFSLETDPVTHLTPIASHSVCSDKNADHTHTHTPLPLLFHYIHFRLCSAAICSQMLGRLLLCPLWRLSLVELMIGPVTSTPHHRWCSRVWAYKLYLYMLFLLAHL
jgi:hypothetical protein